MHKLVLGLANLNNSYGHLKNSLTANEFNKILSKKKQTLIDTAILYKGSSKILKKERKRIVIISKLPKLDLKKGIDKQISSIIKDYFNEIGVNKIDTLLLHRPEQLLKKGGVKIYEALIKLKKNKTIKNFGYSLYQDLYLGILIKKFKPDVLQFPLNILNNRFTTNRNIKLMKRKKIIIQVRSIFLQGILLNDDKIEKYLYALKKYVNKIKIFSIKNEITNLDCCINFIKDQKYIDQIIIGCNSLKNFNEIEKSFKKKILLYPKINMLNKEKKLVDPRNWK